MRTPLPLTLALLAALPAVSAPAPAKKPAKKPAGTKASTKAPAKAPAKTPAKTASKTPAQPAPAKPAPARAPEPQNVDIGSLAGVLPGNWAVQPPIGQFRLSQYELPRAAGDTKPSQLIVFHFGQGGGGTVEDNVKRWYGLMAQPDGRDSAEVAKRAEAAREGLKITSVDIPGTYRERPFPFSTEFVERPNYRMLAAVVETTGEGSDGPYFLRIVGPVKTVDAAKAGWDALLQSLKAR